MDDPLATGFAGLFDDREDADWRDVRRRVRRRRLLPLAVGAAALVLTAAAVASVGAGWRLFSHRDGSVSGIAAVTLPDGRWTVRIELRPESPTISAPHRRTVTLGGGGATYVLRDPRGRVAVTGTAASTFRVLRTGRSIVSRVLDFRVYVERRHVVAFGIARADVANVRLVAGKTSSTAATVETNRLLNARLWVAAVPVEAARMRIVASTGSGRVIATVPVDVHGAGPLSVAGSTYQSRR